MNRKKKFGKNFEFLRDNFIDHDSKFGLFPKRKEMNLHRHEKKEELGKILSQSFLKKKENSSLKKFFWKEEIPLQKEFFVHK